MDRSWIALDDYTSKDYVDGVNTFMRFALEKMVKRDNMPCPCGKCLNQNFYPPGLVKLHMLTHGMDVSYMEWVYHGEKISIFVENDNIEDHIDENFEEGEMLEDLNFDTYNFTIDGYPQDDYDSYCDNALDVEPNDEMREFQRLLKDTQRQLYPGCPKSLLSFLVKLRHIKVLNGMTNKCCDPYVLANQVKQVFYVNDTKLGGNWKVVQSAQHRHLFDPSLLQSPTEVELDTIDAYQQESCAHIEVQNNGKKLGPIVRTDETPIQIEVADFFLHQCVNNEKEVEEEEEEEDEDEDEDNILVEYYSSDDEVMSQLYVDSDLD